jgi:shikimate kinase
MTATLAFHRWLMKYSGMTMIIDNVEERRRWRRSTDHPEEASIFTGEGESAFHKQEMEAFKGTVSNEDSSAASTGEVSESTEENKEVLG